MTELQLSLTRLLGKKDLSFGCLIKKSKGDVLHAITQYDSHSFFHYVLTGTSVYVGHSIYDVIGHPPTLSDLHRWLNGKYEWSQDDENLYIEMDLKKCFRGKYLYYDSSKDILDQDELTIKAIINLITSHKSHER